MRVVIAEDSAILREGLTHLLTLRGLNSEFHRIVVDAADSAFVDQILGSLRYPLVR